MVEVDVGVEVGVGIEVGVEVGVVEVGVEVDVVAILLFRVVGWSGVVGEVVDKAISAFN